MQLLFSNLINRTVKICRKYSVIDLSTFALLTATTATEIGCLSYFYFIILLYLFYYFIITSLFILLFILLFYLFYIYFYFILHIFPLFFLLLSCCRWQMRIAAKEATTSERTETEVIETVELHKASSTSRVDPLKKVCYYDSISTSPNTTCLHKPKRPVATQEYVHSLPPLDFKGNL